MKKTFLISIFSAGLSILNIHAQTFIGKMVTERQQNLSTFFTKAEIYKLQPEEITAYTKRSSNGFPVTFIFGSEIFEWKIYEHDLMRPESRVTTMKDGQKIDIEVDRTCKTFIGFRDDMAESARFTISGKYFAAMIPSGKTYTYIQPLADFIKGSDSDLFVLYTPENVITAKGASCNHVLPRKKEKTTDESGARNNRQQGNSRTYNCRELQVTLANDSEMHEEFGAVVDEINFDLTVLFFMEPYYDDFDLDFWVDEIFSVTSNFLDDNPWGTTSEVSDLQPDFGDWAYDHFSSEDIGALWTTQDLHDDDDYGVVGYASVGGACSDIGVYPWALLQNFNSNNLYSLSILQAHEFGHLLDAEHAPGTGSIMEPSLNDVDGPYWAQDNIEDMFDFMEDETCIESCVHCPISYDIIDYIGWGDWKYSAIDHISSTAIIDSFADVVFQANNYIKLTPGFSASAIQPSSANGTFIAKIDACE